jgi:hypothetical protein
MNLHLERRLEVLAKEIAAAKTPWINEAANALFKEVGQSDKRKTDSDKHASPAQKQKFKAQKFKVGDRVRITYAGNRPLSTSFKGAEGEVRLCNAGTINPILVHHYGEEDRSGQWRCWSHEDLELIQSAEED